MTPKLFKIQPFFTAPSPAAQKLELLRQQHPHAKVLVHPESPAHVVQQADVVGSTSQLLKAVLDGAEGDAFIVATDNGIMHRMRQLAPG